MDKHRKVITILMWAIFLVCIAAPFQKGGTDQTFDEIATVLICIVLSLSTNLLLARLMLFLAIGKMIDGQMTPCGYSIQEACWDLLGIIIVSISYFKRRKAAKK